MKRHERIRFIISCWIDDVPRMTSGRVLGMKG